MNSKNSLNQPTRTIIIAHGLLMNNLVMQYLKKSFSSLGYNVILYNYPTLRYDREKCFDELTKLCLDNANGELCFLGHSMGGLVLRDFMNSQDFLHPNSCLVTLGTPHRTSSFAKALNSGLRAHLFGFLFSKNHSSGLLTELPQWQGKYDMGCIAGTLGLGPKNFLSPYSGLEGSSEVKSDGTVLTHEASCEGCKDYLELPLNHTQLVYSSKVTAAAHNFFTHRNFNAVHVPVKQKKRKI